MKYTKEQRQDFEQWISSEFFGGMHDISEDWDEERNCYKDFAFHIAFQSWMAANAQYKYFGQTEFGSRVYLKGKS